ncbi:glycosyltransferase family 25 protein [uncultured Pluralibacter sp.]|uniref:glycosyltransferase family 25 protein n=1 Tax=uncultured Pluralibacter sp. TaxID=1490864 RepID=UPI0026280B63|nr:glycosyltransferase family 25 protein [uncultured Pluralibacter sp.]
MRNIVISLKNKSEERRSFVKEEFKKAAVAFEFFDAVTPADFDAKDKPLSLSDGCFAIRPSEKACFLSHIAVWDIMIDENLPYIAVFEDDIHLSADAGLYLSSDDWIPDDAGLIKLEKYNDINFKVSGQRNTLNNRILFRLGEANWGTAGYIIKKETAEMLKASFAGKKSLKAIDDELFLNHLNKFGHFYQLEPAICIQDVIKNNRVNFQFESTVTPVKNAGKNKSLIKTIKKLIRFKKIKRAFKKLFLSNMLSTME